MLSIASSFATHYSSLISDYCSNTIYHVVAPLAHLVSVDYQLLSLIPPPVLSQLQVRITKLADFSQFFFKLEPFLLWAVLLGKKDAFRLDGYLIMSGGKCPAFFRFFPFSPPPQRKPWSTICPSPTRSKTLSLTYMMPLDGHSSLVNSLGCTKRYSVKLLPRYVSNTTKVYL